MEGTLSIKPLLALGTSALAALLILFTGERRKNLREGWTLLASVIKFSIVASMIPAILQGKTLEWTLIELFPGVSFQFRVDTFGLFFAILASSLWIATSVYSIGYMRGLRSASQTRFFFCFALALHGALGIAFAGNLLTLFIFYEILTVSTFPLVAHKETEEAISGGRKYLAYLLTGATLIILAMGLTYTLSGNLNFKAGGFLKGYGKDPHLILIFTIFTIGFGTKAALMPLHEWLPTAMVAPTPVSALLHAVAVVKAGVFCVLRVILYVFGPQLLAELNLSLILAYVASFTILVSGMLALAQDHLKRRLAFSTINNLAIIILGASLLSPSGITGSIFHIAAHGFMKITLFFVAGAIYVKTHKEKVSELDGIGKAMPVTMASFSIAALGISGIPPMAGFISKWYLCLGSLEAKEMLFLLVLLGSALLDIAYFVPIIYHSFFKKPSGDLFLRVDEASLWMVAPITICAIGSIMLGLFPNAIFHFFEIAMLSAKSVLGVP